MSTKISISRPVVKIRPVQRHRIVVRARDVELQCHGTVEMSGRLYGYEKRIRGVLPSFRGPNSKASDSLGELILLPITCAATRVLETTYPVYNRLHYPLTVLTVVQLLYLMALVVFPRFTIILSTAVVVVFLSLQPLALVYKLLLSNANNLLCQLESRLADFYALLQASLDRHLERLVSDLEEKARNRNPSSTLVPEPSKTVPQETLISCPLPKIALSQYYPTPTPTPRADPCILGGAQPALHREIRRNPPAALPEFDKEGWLLVCDPELGLQVPNQDATPLRGSMLLSPSLAGVQSNNLVSPPINV